MWFILLGLALASAAQDHPAAPHAHAEAQSLANPVTATPDSMAAAAKIYAKLCANCHGAGGRGNGRLAAGMAAYGRRPSDLTDDIWQHGSTDGEMFVVIRDGIGPDFHMDAFARLIPDEDIWRVVHYIRSLAIAK
jgi:mono/diheme cytochrome c family protein